MITLPARLEDELNWDQPRSLAKKQAASGELIFWEIDFGLGTLPLCLNETASFLSYALALETFTKTLWEEFKSHTFGLSLYRGPLDLAKRFIWSEEHLAHFQEFKTGDEIWGKEIFCTTVFAEYLQRLTAYLPEELDVFCRFDLADIHSPAKAAQLLSKERFRHIQVQVEHSCPESSLAVCLPPDEYCDLEVLRRLDQVFLELNKKQISFRIIPENLLTEEWLGVDELIVLKEVLSPLGKRKLQGFFAAGGKVVYNEN